MIAPPCCNAGRGAEGWELVAAIELQSRLSGGWSGLDSGQQTAECIAATSRSAAASTSNIMPSSSILVLLPVRVRWTGLAGQVSCRLERLAVLAALLLPRTRAQADICPVFSSNFN